MTLVIGKLIAAYLAGETMGVSHHIRFLLAGSNPFGMAGGASLLLGAVDSLFDWREDAAFRRATPLKFWATTAVKFVLTPLGLVMMAGECVWDLVFLRRHPRIVTCKHREFFALAVYHNLICPEKSNDIFYADLAYAKYCDNVFLYQWNRMRSMVFELQHYKIDIEQRIGSVETNLFRVGDLAAYQILKRLQIERIEKTLETHFAERPEDFPIPHKIAAKLVTNARPIKHYLRMRSELLERGLLPEPTLDCERALDELIPRADVWHVLRLLDEPAPCAGSLPYVATDVIERLVEEGVLEHDASAVRFRDRFRGELEQLLEQQFREASAEEAVAEELLRIPVAVSYGGVLYLPKGPQK